MRTCTQSASDTSVFQEKMNFVPCDDRFRKADSGAGMFVGWINIYHVKVYSFLCDGVYKQSSLLYNEDAVICQSAQCELWMCCCSWCFVQFTFKRYVKQTYQVSVYVYTKWMCLNIMCSETK